MDILISLLTNKSIFHYVVVTDKNTKMSTGGRNLCFDFVVIHWTGDEPSPGSEFQKNVYTSGCCKRMYMSSDDFWS